MDKLKKIETDLKREISFVIISKIKDPRIGFVTVTGVKLSSDYHYMDIFVSVMGEERKVEDSMDCLKHCAGFIKKHLKQRFRIKSMPELRFIHDRSINNGLRISKLLENLKTKK